MIITTGNGYFTIDEVIFPVNSGVIEKLTNGVRFTYNSGQFINNENIFIPVEGTTFNGFTVSSVDDLHTLAKDNFFRKGGDNGTGVVNGMLYFEDTQFDGDGTEQDPIRLKV